MTQPPDDAALVARLRTLGAPLEGTDRDGAGHSIQGRAMWDAATALEAKDRRIAEMEAALTRCADIVDRNLYRQHEKVEDVPRIARAALESSDKGVGR